jgi:hypothetical protein
MGFIYSEKKDLKSAENIYKEMIAYSPKSTEPYLELAYTCWIKSWTNESSGTSASEMLAYDKLN